MNFYEMELYELYYLALVSQFYQDKDIISVDIDELIKEVNKRYKEEYGKYLEDEVALFKWISDRCRYRLLDELLVRLYDRFINIEKGNKYEIDNTDIFFVNNIHEMKRIIEEEENTAYNAINVLEYKNRTNLNKWQVIDMVRNILQEIDLTGEWKLLYDEAIDNNLIIYLNELSSEEIDAFKKNNGIDISLDDVKNACLFSQDGKMFILLSYEGYISDVAKTIHEVIHYISRYYNNNQKEKTILRELPSMFYEMYALKYMYELGYDSKELEETNIYRLIDTYESISDIKALVNYLIILIEKGHITKDDIENEFIEYLDKLNGKIMEYDYIEKESNNRCDKCCDDLIKNPYMLFGYYPYIIDNYLASMAINKIDNDKFIFNFMKYITEHISTVCLEDVFNIIMDGKIDLYQEDNRKVMVRNK